MVKPEYWEQLEAFPDVDVDLDNVDWDAEPPRIDMPEELKFADTPEEIDDEDLDAV